MFTRASATHRPQNLALLLAASLVFAAGFAAGSGWPALGSGPATAGVTGPADDPWPVGAGYPAEVLKVNDGDTFEARVAIWPGTHVTTKVRLRGIDTPEHRAKCPGEHRKAVAATQMLTDILADRRARLTQVNLDKYGGRVLADVSTRATPDVAAALQSAGLARRYDGGRRESWCAQTSLR